MAMTIPIRTKTTIAICSQIQVGDMILTSLLLRNVREAARAGTDTSIVQG